MDDQRCSLLDGPSHLPPHSSSPSSTPPVAERKCESSPCVLVCFHTMCNSSILSYLLGRNASGNMEEKFYFMGVLISYNGVNSACLQNLCPFQIRCCVINPLCLCQRNLFPPKAAISFGPRNYLSFIQPLVRITTREAQCFIHTGLICLMSVFKLHLFNFNPSALQPPCIISDSRGNDIRQHPFYTG